jgi:predicted metalloprotease with PDZ domain
MQRNPRLAHPAGTAFAAGGRAALIGAVRTGLAGLACFTATTWPVASLALTPATPLADAAAIPQPTPRDAPYAGVITLAVDATDLDHRVLRVQQTVPVAQPGRLTLLYPRWLPGTHGPYGDVDRLAGLQVRAGERNVPWQRDMVDPYAFHIDVPAGVSTLTLSYEHLTPTERGQGRVSMTRALLGVQWNQTVLYPAGHYASAIRVAASVKLPGGWQQASALRAADGSVAQAGPDGWVRFAPVSLETLVDSPLFAGPNAKRIELDPPGTPNPVALNLLADEASQLEASTAQLDAHKALVQQADKLYGSRPWRHYDFLLALSNSFGGIGLEHHESSENGVRGNYFKDWDKAIRARGLLPHEYTHAWNGKFRRPADLWTPQYNVPMRNPLLWVYEGMTQYWGQVLTARSGLATPEQARDALAQLAANLDARSGRTWRSLQDTTTEGTLASQRNKIWRDWQRSADYYDEAVLIWLDADTLIREKSRDTKSLDDFARAFFGPTMQPHDDGSPKSMTYSFDDVVKTLNGVQPHDWATFLRARLDRTGPGAPLDGLLRSGWKLGWSETESEFAKHSEGRGGPSGRERPDDFMFSLGLQIASDGELDQVMWNSPAFQAGAATGQKLMAVNMQVYKPERLAAAISANKNGSAPIELLVKDGEVYKLMRIDWRGGLRYPKLERIDDAPDRLGAIWAAK